MRAGRVIKYNDQFKSNAVRQVVTYFGSSHRPHKSGVQRAKSRSVELERAGDSVGKRRDVANWIRQ